MNGILQGIEDKIKNHTPLNEQERAFLQEKNIFSPPSQEQLDFLNQPYYYRGANPTADCLVIIEDKILLVLRDDHCVEGNKWAIPGGFVDTTSKYGEVWQETYETPLQAAVRELSEEANCDLSELMDKAVFVNIFEGNQRDPRDNCISWSKSYAYLFYLTESDLSAEKMQAIEALDEVKKAQWHSLDNLPVLAFDHAKIIKEALIKIK